MSLYDDFLNKTISENYELSDMCQGLSFRTYQRVSTASGQTFVLMIVPINQALEDGQTAIQGVIRPFIQVAKYLEALSIKVPAILDVDEGNGLVLLEDFGGDTFFDLYHKGDINEDAFQASVDVLVKLYKSAPLETAPVYDVTLANLRGDFFLDDYLPALRNGEESSKQEYDELKAITSKLYKTIMNVKQGTILWDYHSPNLMPLGGTGIESVGVLDFQDAKIGPLTYDLASLLYDARFTFPESLREQFLNYFMEQAGVEDKEAFRTSFELSALLRLLGVVGRFARAAYRDGRVEFVEKIAILWPYIDEALKNPHAADLKAFLEKSMPEQRMIAV